MLIIELKYRCNKTLEANVIDGGVVKDVQEGYISVGGVWQKWWPPPST